jgi:hypothetical protein
VNVHAKSCLTPEPLGALRSEDKGQAGACPDRTRAIPCTVRASLLPDSLRRVDSNRDSNSSDQRQAAATATAHNARTIRANLRFVRPEKQTVEDQRRFAATVAKTVAKPLNNTRRTWTTLEYRPSPRPVTDGPGRCAHPYGSDGPDTKHGRAVRLNDPEIARSADRERPRRAVRRWPRSGWGLARRCCRGLLSGDPAGEEHGDQCDYGEHRQ